jgi:hypothetical protein
MRQIVTGIGSTMEEEELIHNLNDKDILCGKLADLCEISYRMGWGVS